MASRPRSDDSKRDGPAVAAAPRKPRAKLSVWKKALFSLLVNVAFFVLLELVLAACGVQPVLYVEDPYVGFSSHVPLFGERHGTDGRNYMLTVINKLTWFNEQRFPKEKHAGTYRIFCMGGSTTHGRPYDDTTSFCGWLRELLFAADDSRKWEVINAGGISYASYRVAKLMEELIRYEPDLFIIYSGHNEFLERRTYASLLEMPSTVRGLGTFLSHTRSYAALKRLVHTRADKSSGDRSKRYELPGEVEALLDNAIGPEAYTRDDELTQQVLSHYRFNLVRMVDIARSVGARVILVTPASNLKDSSPFKSEHGSRLGDTDLRRFPNLLDRAEKEFAAGRFADALTALNEAATIDDRFAHLHYLRGRVLLGLKRDAEAKAAFLSARDEDVCPLRALTPMYNIITDIAAGKIVPLVDFVAIVEERSEHSITGDEVFLDHVHPTIAGNRLLALSLFDELVSQRIVRPKSSWGDEAIKRVTKRIESKLDRRAHGLALRNLSKVLGWAGKTEEADKLALRAVEMIPDNAEAHHRAGNVFFGKGDLEQARIHYEHALRLNSDSAWDHYGLGFVYAKRQDFAQAVFHYEQALQIDPDFAPVHYNLGLVYEALNKLDQAEDHFQQAIRLNPHDFGPYNNLGVVFVKRGQLDQAQTQFEHALRINPQFAHAHTNLGLVFDQRSNLRKASRLYREALRYQPDHVVAAGKLAWILATSNDPSLRSGTEAVRLAKQCAASTGYQQHWILNTLAAACAEAGDFEEAVHWQTKALQLVPAEQRAGYGLCLELYKAGKPYRRGTKK